MRSSGSVPENAQDNATISTRQRRDPAKDGTLGLYYLKKNSLSCFLRSFRYVWEHHMRFQYRDSQTRRCQHQDSHTTRVRHAILTHALSDIPNPNTTHSLECDIKDTQTSAMYLNCEIKYEKTIFPVQCGSCLWRYVFDFALTSSLCAGSSAFESCSSCSSASIFSRTCFASSILRFERRDIVFVRNLASSLVASDLTSVPHVE